MLHIYTIYTEADAAARERLAQLLLPLVRRGLCQYTDRSQMLAGADRSAWLNAQHQAAEVVLVLSSADLLADEQALAEVAAVQAHGRARIIPIIVRPVDLSLSPLAALRALPVEARSVAEAPQPDRAWQNIQTELKRQFLHQAMARPEAGQARLSFYVLRLLLAVLSPYRAVLLGLLSLLLLLCCYGLGAAALQARAQLLGIDPDTFAYPLHRPLLEGLGVLPGLLWRIALIGGGIGPERSLGWGPLLLIAVPLLLGRWPRLRQAALSLSLAAALVGALALVAAIRLHHVALDASGQAVQSHPAAGSLLDEAAFEIASWLRNGGDLNDKRRAALVGLYGLGWLACLGLLAQSLGSRHAGRPERGIAAGFGLLALLLTVQAPRAYALGRWGLQYRPVLQLAPACEVELAAALAQGSCTAWDVSDGAQPEVLLLRGRHCPGRADSKPTVRVLAVPTERPCILSRGDSEPVLKGS